MPAGAEFTRRPFTVVVCSGCATGPGQLVPEAVAEAVQGAVRCCPHGILVSVNCLLGPSLCATRPSDGVVAAFQPCALDRSPTGPARLVGPVRGESDSARLCAWIRSGRWHAAPLPLAFPHRN